jgi:hypothetical protein
VSEKISDRNFSRHNHEIILTEKRFINKISMEMFGGGGGGDYDDDNAYQTTCEICNRSFRQKQVMQKHIRNYHHGISIAFGLV